MGKASKKVGKIDWL